MNHNFIRVCLVTLLMSIMVGCTVQDEQTSELSLESKSNGILKSSDVTSITIISNNQMKARPVGQNLVNDFNFNDLSNQWTISKIGDPEAHEVVQIDEKLPGNLIVKALCVKTDSEVHVISRKVSVDPNKAYQFSIWLKQEKSQSGSRWFGLYAYNAEGALVNILQPNGEVVKNQYFYYGNEFQDGQWHHLIGYLLPSNLGDNWAVPLDATTPYSFRMTADVKEVVLRFLSAYNKGMIIKAWFALPSIMEIEFN